jgi:hypothetical protein
MAGQGFVAVVGARVVPEAAAGQVAAVVQHFLGRGWGIGSGGARGADAYALGAVIQAGPGACGRSVMFLPGRVPAGDDQFRRFLAHGGRVVTGFGGGRLALLARSRRLAREACGVVAFLWGPSRGSVFTVREGIRAGKPAAVVLAGCGAELPAFRGGRWVPCRLGSVEAFRWEADARAPEPARRSWLARVFELPEGEPTQAVLEHIGSLSAGERLWFERGVLAGDTVVVAHEPLSDTPAFLNARRLMRRFGCTAREAVDLAELFLALEASPAVVAHYEGEARRVDVANIIEDLVRLVAGVALAEQVDDGDAFHHVQSLGDAVDSIDDDGQIARSAVHSDGEDGSGATPDVQWHALGSVHPERMPCPVCRAAYEVDDDSPDLPTCPDCGAVDTWEARQGGRFRGIVGAIDSAQNLTALGALGKPLYALGLTHDQAGVAWMHYHLCKARLEQAVTLGRPALGLLTQVERAPRQVLSRLGSRLYRLQHAGVAAVSSTEWRRIWSVYRARREGVAP